MARALKDAASSKGQQNITAFFGGASGKPIPKPAPKAATKAASSSRKKKPVIISDDEPEAPSDEDPSDSSDTDHQTLADADEDGTHSEETSSTRKISTYVGGPDLPPISSIPSIFSDMVKRFPQIKSVVEHLNGRKMRVATMCSGTESPLLALDLIRRAVSDLYGINLEFEHVFSCEIEPFKQAYIERNFHPPLLFRDVCELGNSHATTVYGALAPVPGDVDMLIAGTSCVDFSNLNNEKQGINDGGESSRTFQGMMSWVKRHRPPLVIMENVCSAPWAEIIKYWERTKYSASQLRVDTKFYYIPHTRTRGYLLAVDKKGSSLTEKWMKVLNEMKRPASSTLDAFLLPTDDPRIHQAREKLVRETEKDRGGRLDWSRCENRHQRARLDEQLGNKRPLTGWEEGGQCKLPDFAWNDWGIAQVERVWDLMDISLMRDAKKGVDPSFKTQVWNLSQNVDRSTGSSKAGICPCLTPSMIPYVTNRGGPMVGLEALSLQGLPVDELLLTRETEDQLADLAGNAMSTTVVGAVMMAAMFVAKELLKSGDDGQTYEQKKQIVADDDDEEEDATMEIDQSHTGDSVEDHITGEGLLTEKPLPLAATSKTSLQELLTDAERSVRFCLCEGRTTVTDRQVLRCKDCGSTACVKCAGRPEHNYEPIDVIANPRIHPSQFEQKLKDTLPMSVEVGPVTQDLLDDLKTSAALLIPEKRWTRWTQAVLRATREELRFAEPKRQDIWSITYQSPSALLELSLHPQQPEWRLFGKPLDNEPANSELRRLLENYPVARFVCKDGLFNGRWEFAFPHTIAVPLTIKGSEPVPSYEQKLGLQVPNLRDKMVNSILNISVPAEQVQKFERNISGAYTLFDKCGTAMGALHKKEATDADSGLPPIYLFLDPFRCSDPKDDGFVFSISKRRLEYGETRPVIAELDVKWRQSTKESQVVSCIVPYRWTESAEVSLKPAQIRDAICATPAANFELDLTTESCASNRAFLVCKVPLDEEAGPEWPRGRWQEVDKVHERITFKALAWLLERVKNVDDRFGEWMTSNSPHDYAGCQRCAPTPPEIHWALVKHSPVAVEDPVQAGAYERALKQRPPPFITQLKLDERQIATVRIGINFASLMHRALSRMPPTTGKTGQTSIVWRIQTNYVPIARLPRHKFTLSSNRLDSQHKQPPSFKIPLRPEQLRSLTWMVAQESPKAEPFIEEEISEAVLEPLGWRAEGRAQRPINVRGGVLADEVGYGKTAITLGLIDCTAMKIKDAVKENDVIPGKIAVKGTLVIVPPHLGVQWQSEVEKFTKKDRFKVRLLNNAAHLNAATIKDIMDADIIIVASTLFRSDKYLENLSSVAGSCPIPSKGSGGRYANACIEMAHSSLRRHVDLLRDEGASALMKSIEEASKKGPDAHLVLPTKRLKGKTYRNATRDVEIKEESPKDEHPVQVKSSKAKPLNGKIMEVFIPRPPKRKTSTSASSSATEASPPVASSKRRASKKIIVNDSDEDAGDSNGSDYYESPAEESGDEAEDVVDSDEEDKKGKSKPKPKAKGKAKAVSKPRGSASTVLDSDVATSEDAMDVDEQAPTKGKGKKPAVSSKKRKSVEPDDDDKRPAKKTKQPRHESDPWKLNTKAVKRDWTQMKAPPLEMFHFARKVIDEYTYLGGLVLSMTSRLSADRVWVLSGTPPVQDFPAIKTISAFLGVHLGVDADLPEKPRRGARKTDLTAAEQFHSFRETHTLEWHAHRNEIGQMFLNRFVRQNIAEIEEIPWKEHVMKIELPAAERAIYLELEHYLRALDMTIKRGRKNESDREKRMHQALGESASAEEALLKRCSHFDLETADPKHAHENAMKACDVIVEERRKQLEDCKADLLRQITNAFRWEKAIGKMDEESLFREYVRISQSESVGDKEATDIVRAIIDRALDEWNTSKGPKPEGKTDDLKWEHREQTHDIRRTQRELLGRVRSLRYFTVVRNLQSEREEPYVISCPICGRDNIGIDKIAVLSSCGHTGCYACVMKYADREECVYAPQGDCRAAARVLNVVKGATLGVDDVARDGKGKHFGRKLETVIDLLQNKIPKTDRVLIFVQFQDLIKKVSEALEHAKIGFLQIKGSASDKSKALKNYQNNSKERILLLNVMDESASGANLTIANHAIFISPLLTDSKETYLANETQAVGRVRRYGQTKTVHIYRFFSMNTIDVETYEQRTGIRLES
ncbi:unnamed protein product [Somion occarium]|uniref:DNA repair protein rad8 n=1 Tax=Somion occarium TaxID=3059160 RepID=A0ABP1E4S8_9APHY